MSGHLPPVLRPVTVPASWIYRVVINRRNHRYDQPRNVTQTDRPVISIGNLTTGGTGKTPMVTWIVETLLNMGHRPAIAMRGYGARPGQKSDEALEYEDRWPNVPVFIDPDRAAGISRGLEVHPQIDCIVLDDGFQHRRLKRDLDVVLIDASRDTHRDELLPAGSLREPPAALARADAIILTHADIVPAALDAWIQKYHGAAALARTRHVWRGLQQHDRSGSTPLPGEWLRGRRVVTLLGIGHPQSVIRQVEAAGATVLADIAARDHARYDRTLVLSIVPLLDQADALFTTVKDWVKLRELIDFGSFPVPVVTPDLGIEFLAGEELLRTRLEDALRTARRNRDS